MTDFQQIAHEAAQGLRADFQATKDREERARVATAIGNLGKSWVSLQDSKREILGRPKIGVRKYVEKKKARPMYEGPIDWPDEPIEETASQEQSDCGSEDAVK